MTKTMKKYFILISAALLSLACTKEIVDEQEVYEGEYKTITFESVMTKTTLAESGEVAWEAGDQISVYYVADGVAKEVVATASAAGTTSTFTTQIPIEDNPTEYYAAYPAGSGVMEVVNDTTNFYVYVKPDAAAGTFKSVNYSASYTKAEDMAFQFHNAVGMIRLALPEGGKFTKDGVDYTLTGVYMRGQTSAFDGKQNTGLLPFSTDGTFGAVTSKTIGETEYSKAANINMPNLSAEALASGFVYIPSIEGTWPTGLCIRYIANYGEKTRAALPAVLSKPNVISIEKGKILKLDDQTEKVQFNYYVSADGSGDGLTTENPMNLAKMQEMFTASGEAQFSAYVLQGTTFNLAMGTYTLTEPFTIPTAKAAYSATIKGEGAGKTILDGGSNVRIMKISDNTHIYLSDLALQNGSHTSGAGIAFAPSSEATDKNFILDCENCLFKSNIATTGNGGALYCTDDGKGGLARFNNCRFDGNTAATSGAVLYTGAGKVAFLFNKCSIICPASAGTKNGIVMQLNNAVCRLGLNNTTINAGNTTTANGSNGAAVTNKGYSVIANTTIWSSTNIGVWGSIALGSNTDEKGSTVVNSFIKNGKAGNATNYNAFYFHTNYYQNVSYCLYAGATGTTKNGAVPLNSVDVGTSLVYDGSANVTKKINGVTLAGYNLDWTANATAFGDFSCPTLEYVEEAIKNTSGVGEIFLSWLKTIPESLTTDMFGVARPEECSCPGALQFTGAPTANN